MRAKRKRREENEEKASMKYGHCIKMGRERRKAPGRRADLIAPYPLSHSFEPLPCPLRLAASLLCP